MICVVDASVAAKWFADGQWARREDDVDSAVELLLASRRDQVSFLQPPHFVAEVAAVLARNKPDTAQEDLRDLLCLDIRYAEDDAPYATAVDLAVRLNHHLFDTLYHALALETPGAAFVTADRRYYDKARGVGRIVWLPELVLA